MDTDGKEQARIGVQSGQGSTPGLLFFDEAGKARLRIGANIGKGGSAGLVFYNEEQTEAGALMNAGKRAKDGKIEASSVLTMDQFQSDEVVRLVSSQNGDQKRQGLIISERPDILSPQAEKLLNDVRTALESAKSNAERQAIRSEYFSKLPTREFGARRLFSGRDVEGSSVVTLSDQDEKPRLQLKVDKKGQASIIFLDASGKVVRTIKP